MELAKTEKAKQEAHPAADVPKKADTEHAEHPRAKAKGRAEVLERMEALESALRATERHRLDATISARTWGD